MFSAYAPNEMNNECAIVSSTNFTNKTHSEIRLINPLQHNLIQNTYVRKSLFWFAAVSKAIDFNDTIITTNK